MILDEDNSSFENCQKSLKKKKHQIKGIQKPTGS